MGLSPGAAKKAGITLWPTESKLGRQYNSLLVQIHSSMEGGNRLVQPFKGEATLDRNEFQALTVPFAYFVALAKSDVSPFSAILDNELPEAFRTLSPPIPTGYPPTAELLTELRGTYDSSHEELVPRENGENDVENVSEKLTRGDKQLLQYCGLMLYWVHEKHMPKEWHSRAKPNLSALEAELLPWLHARVEVGVEVPKAGTMRKCLALALEAFRSGNIELKPLADTTK